MKAERLAQVEDIYHAVLEVSAEEWPSFLTSSCGGDADLRREVESLLSYSNKPHSLIDVPPLDVAAELVRENHHPNIIGKRSNITRYFRRSVRAAWAMSFSQRIPSSNATSRSNLSANNFRKTLRA
ncbi:MAG: hypothetical protein IPG67_12560 [Acidobacteria bacterium]|nr:hypothetical protein [Acidobacteriota bacterium]